MATINKDSLKAKLECGRVTIEQARQALCVELNLLDIVVMPTVGTFDAHFASNEVGAMRQLSDRQQHAVDNVKVLREVISELGLVEDLKNCKSCRKFIVGSNPVCSTCYEPSEF